MGVEMFFSGLELGLLGAGLFFVNEGRFNLILDSVSLLI